MMCGSWQGQLLYLLSSLTQPKSILEIGTFTGYAAICMARGMAKDGQLHTIEINPELEHLIRKYIRKAGLDNRIHLHLGDAKEIIPTLNTRFDMVFIDAGKQDNRLYYDLVMPLLRPGGLILVDNVLWGGKVVLGEKDQDTELVRSFNKMVQIDDRVENVLLPLRDGLTLARKKKP